MAERGTYFDMETLPFLRINNIDDLAVYLNAWNNFVPSKEYLDFCQKYCGYDSKATPEYVNDVVTLNRISKKIEVLSYKENAEQWSFNKATEELLIKYANSGIQYVVTPGDMPATMSEVLQLFLYRKFRLFKNAAKRLYLDELKRILPGINVNKIINHSDDAKFKDIFDAVGSLY